MCVCIEYMYVYGGAAAEMVKCLLEAGARVNETDYQVCLCIFVRTHVRTWLIICMYVYMYPSRVCWKLERV